MYSYQPQSCGQPLSGGALDQVVSFSSDRLRFSALEDREKIKVFEPSRLPYRKAMQTCPCGFYGDQHHQCIYSPSQIHRYRSRISGPLLDRIDLHIEVPSLRYKNLSQEGSEEESKSIRERVKKAREIQYKRFSKTKIYCNSQMVSRYIKKFCQIDSESSKLLEMVVDRLGLSARAYTRILKVARTIADLENSENIRAYHVSEAIQYRALDRWQ